MVVETTTTETATTSSFPDASNTGVPAHVSLTPYTGPLTINTAGTVIDGKLVNGCLNIAAGGVIIRNSRVTCTGFYAVDVYPARDSVVVDRGFGDRLRHEPG